MVSHLPGDSIFQYSTAQCTTFLHNRHGGKFNFNSASYILFNGRKRWGDRGECDKMEMNYFRNILIVPTSLNKYIDIHGFFFAVCLNSINQLVKRGRGTVGAGQCVCVQSSGLFIYYFASCEIVFNFLNQITAKPKQL